MSEPVPALRGEKEARGGRAQVVVLTVGNPVGNSEIPEVIIV